MVVPLSAISTPSSDLKVERVAPRNRNKTLPPMILLEAEAKFGKSFGISTIPKRPGTKHTFATGDTQTYDGLVKGWTMLLGSVEKAKDWVDENCTIYEFLENYDPTDIKTAPPTKKHTIQILRQIRADAKAGLIAQFSLEHYAVLQDDVGISLCREEHNLLPSQQIQFNQYGPRGTFLDEVDSYIYAIRNHVDGLWLTGYGERDVIKQVPKTDRDGKPIVDAVTGKEKMMVITVREPPKWIFSRGHQQNASVQLRGQIVREESEMGDGTKISKSRRLVTVLTSQHHGFNESVTLDVTGKGFAPLFEWFKPEAKAEVKA